MNRVDAHSIGFQPNRKAPTQPPISNRWRSPIRSFFSAVAQNFDAHSINQNTRQVVYREFHSLCYSAHHPYHRLADGSIETVQTLMCDALAEFHARYFRPDVMTICIVGDILPTQAIDKIARALGDWKATSVPSEYHIQDAPKPSA